MNAANPLDQLKPNHLPDPIGLWPLATGWWIALGLCILLLVAVFIYAQRRRKQQLSSTGVTTSKSKYINSFIMRHKVQHKPIIQLLKRVALHAYATSKTQVAGLSGNQWCQFLADTASMPAFIEHNAFNHLRYAPNTELNEEAIFILTHQWIKNHRRSLPCNSID